MHLTISSSLGYFLVLTFPLDTAFVPLSNKHDNRLHRITKHDLDKQTIDSPFSLSQKVLTCNHMSTLFDHDVLGDIAGDSSVIFQLSERSTDVLNNIDTAIISQFTSDFSFGENDETFFLAKTVFKSQDDKKSDNQQSPSNMNQRRQQEEQPDITVTESEFTRPKRRISATVKETGFDSMNHYMKTMGNHDLLRKSEEVILAREIQILVQWEEIRETLELKLLRYVV